VSASAEVTVLGPRHWAVSRGDRAQLEERPLIRLVAFAMLALYGVLRWCTLMDPAPTWRMLGMLGLAVVVAGVGAMLASSFRWAVITLVLLAAIAIFPVAGVPISWIHHLRLGVGADAIGQGLSALPNVLVPYLGINHWVRVVIVLGGGILVLDAAVLAAFAPRVAGDLRRAGAALPLVALAVVPATLVRPQLPYLQGLILFALLAAFMWAERAPGRDAIGALVVVGVAGIGALIAAPRIDSHHAWINYRAIAGTFEPTHVDTFNWAQKYGPLVWPQTGQNVFEVQAPHPDYWKTENLDVFDGRGWTSGNVSLPQSAQVIDPVALARWTQTLQVTIRAMRTVDLIAAGDASPPTDVSEGVIAGISPGTWTAAAPLAPGDSYRVSTYSPHPSAAELTAAGTGYPQTIVQGYLQIQLPDKPGPGHIPQTQQAFFTPFGLTGPVYYGATSANPVTEIAGTPYARVYALARRLARGAATPYAFTENVLHYLGHGYSYNQDPPLSRFPIVSFLFADKRGYCQQFAGAMALLLRMGGVPARVAVGFTPGRYNSAIHEYVVADTDAHAWVEAWFPSYGWVRFDPTPGSAPARGGKLIGDSQRRATSAAKSNPSHGFGPTGAIGVRRPHAEGGGFPVGLLIAGIAVLLAIVAIVVPLSGRLAGRGGDELLAELERALRRCGRPIADGVTLAALEQRFRSSEGAAGYVRAIRMQRYGGSGEPPTGVQRRALRAQLATGLGLAGRLRALLALPPRR
jgi:transglutaminase-like putative cysteine protease